MQQLTTSAPVAVNWNLRPAFTWGQEDGVAGVDRRGSVYFTLDSQDYHAYNAGYDSGLRCRQQSQAIRAAADVAPNNRAGRAMQLLATGAVVKNGNGYTVHSQNSSKVYHVTADSCDCPDATYNGATCKHILAVRMTKNMTEQDVLASALEGLRSGQTQPYVVLTDAEIERFDAEPAFTDWQR